MYKIEGGLLGQPDQLASCNYLVSFLSHIRVNGMYIQVNLSSYASPAEIVTAPIATESVGPIVPQVAHRWTAG